LDRKTNPTINQLQQMDVQTDGYATQTGRGPTRRHIRTMHARQQRGEGGTHCGLAIVGRRLIDGIHHREGLHELLYAKKEEHSMSGRRH